MNGRGAPHHVAIGTRSRDRRLCPRPDSEKTTSDTLVLTRIIPHRGGDRQPREVGSDDDGVPRELARCCALSGSGVGPNHILKRQLRDALRLLGLVPASGARHLRRQPHSHRRRLRCVRRKLARGPRPPWPKRWATTATTTTSSSSAAAPAAWCAPPSPRPALPDPTA